MISPLLPAARIFVPRTMMRQILSTPLTQQFERTTQARFLEECKLDNYKVNTINNWVSQRVGKDKMAQVRLAGSELAAAIERLPAGNRPAVDAIAVQWGLPVNAAAKINERSLYQLIATCYVLGQE